VGIYQVSGVEHILLLSHAWSFESLCYLGAGLGIVVPPGALPTTVMGTFGALITVSAVVFLGDGVLFSVPDIGLRTAAARRWPALPLARTIWSLRSVWRQFAAAMVSASLMPKRG
jgi:hypothetical protein